MNAVEVILDNECDYLTVDILMDVLFSSLVTLCNKAPKISKAIERTVSEHYKNYKNMSEKVLREALVFLYRCGLIVLTEVGHGITSGDITSDLLALRSEINFKEELFSRIKISIKYPMFYVAMLRDTLGENLKYIPAALYESIFECHCRGLLPSRYCYEYNSTNVGAEIDYVYPAKSLAVEFTISDEYDAHFDLLPSEYRNVLLTKDIEDVTQEGIIRIPYYKFIYELSDKGVNWLYDYVDRDI